MRALACSKVCVLLHVFPITADAKRRKMEVGASSRVTPRHPLMDTLQSSNTTQHRSNHHVPASSANHPPISLSSCGLNHACVALQIESSMRRSMAIPGGLSDLQGVVSSSQGSNPMAQEITGGPWSRVGARSLGEQAVPTTASGLQGFAAHQPPAQSAWIERMQLKIRLGSTAAGFASRCATSSKLSSTIRNLS